MMLDQAYKVCSMWNYRVVRKKHIYMDPTNNKKERVDFTYGIHEAFYDENGYVGAITQDAIEPFGENVEDLRHSWVMMAEGFGQPVLDYDNIPEPRYDRKNDSIGPELDRRQKDFETGEEKGIPLEQVKRELEEKWGPFDEEKYRKQIEEERLEKERIHNESFADTPTLEELIKKIYSNYQEAMELDKAANPWKYEEKDI